jgi:HTH-type transcriptional regulator/antitoxin HigA
MMKKKEILPFESTHPGTLLKDELNARGIKQKEFAIELGVLPSFLNEIVKGKRPITADFAVLLEKSLEIPADYWMRFQSQYEIDRARIKEKNIARLKLIEIWGIIKEYVPLKFLKKLGYSDLNIESNIAQIKRIYDIENIDDLVDLFASHKNLAFYRKSAKLKIDDVNMLGWSKVVEFQANEMQMKSFKETEIPKLIEELKSIFYENDNVITKVTLKLSNYGIKSIFLQKFEKTPIDGYSFWSGKNPAIGMTLRHKRIDNFAFTLFHELGHITLHIAKNKDKKFLDITGYDQKDLCEKEANEFAKINLISPNQWNQLLKVFRPLNDKNIIAFSKLYKISPAIVLGRLNWVSDNYKIRSSIDKSLY